MSSSSHVDQLRDEPVPKLLWNLSLPATVGMLVMASYNIVDTIFVGQLVGVEAIAGLAIAFPLQMVLMGLCQSFGVGGGVMVSMALGKERRDLAESYLGNVFFLTMLSGIFFTAAVALFQDPVLQVFGASEATLPVAGQYVSIMVAGFLPFAGSVALNNQVRAEGNAKVAMATMVISAGTNIVLDAVFIWGLRWGVAGAAWATVIANWASFAFLLYYYLARRSYVRLRLSACRPQPAVIRRIIVLGASVFARNSASSIMTVLIHHVLNRTGTPIHIALYGIFYRLAMFLFMPLFGLAQGLQPIIGYHEGANHPEKSMQALRLSTVVATVITVTGFALLWLFPGQMVRVFSTDPELVSEGVWMLRIASAGIPLVGYHVVGVTMFQAMGLAAPSFILSMSRQVFFFIPMLLLLPNVFGLTGVWLAFPLSDVCSFLLTVALFEPLKKKLRLRVALAANSPVENQGGA